MDERATPQRDDAALLAELVEAGGFWRLAPEWVPRGGYVGPSAPLLLMVRDGLERRLTHERP